MTCSSIRIRRAGLDDLVRILEIERAGFGRHAWPRELFVEYMEDCGEVFLVAECGKRVAGYLIACLKGWRGELVSIAVDPAARRTGVGEALLRSALGRLRRRGAERVSLMVKVTNKGAAAFYLRFGFRHVRHVRGYYEDGRDGWLMIRPL